MKLTQNQFYGLKSDLPSFLREGSVFLCSDTKEMYIYIEGDIPFRLVEGEKDVITRDELEEAIANIPGGGGGGDVIIVVSNYSALPNPTTVSEKFYYVNESQGTKWMPGSLGGTYYPKGIYYSNGTAWSYIETPYQSTQDEVNAGINNDKFVTALTLANYSKWSTKYDSSNPAGYISNANLTYSPAVNGGTVLSENGTDAFIPNTDFTNAGLMTAEEKKLLYDMASTGITKFDGISINTDTTKFNVGIIEGWFIDNTTNPSVQTKVFKSFPASTGNSVPSIALQNATYIAIDINGILQFSATSFKPEQQRPLISIGTIVHSNRVNINAVNNQPAVSLSPASQFSDLVESIGVFNISGNVFSANGANLSINKSSGKIFKQGANFLNNNKDPHTLDLAALVAPSSLRYRTNIGTEFANTQFIDPGFYDLNGVRTAIPGTRWSIQRIYVFQSNLVRIQYGQATYTTLQEAIQSIATELFVVEQNVLENGLFRGLLIVREGATDLTDLSRALFIETSRFGSVAGLGSLSTTNLQQAYNNSINPEITTNSTLGAFTIKRGSAADTDNVFEISNLINIVVGRMTASGLLELISPTDNTSQIVLKFPSGSNNDRTGILFKGNDGSFNINYAEVVGGVENWSGDHGYFGVRTARATILAERFRFTSNGTLEVGSGYTGLSGNLQNGLMVQGNVLIGTTIDSGHKLNVNGSIKAEGVIRLKGYTVSTLPVGNQGDTAFVTDALAPSYLVTVVGGGAVVTVVFYNGTNWISH